MEPFTLQWAAEKLGARIIGDDTTITAVCTDTRKIEPGALFFALQGEQVDGHRFVAQAFAGGAAAAVVSQDIEGATGPLLVVPDTTQALGDLAMHYRRQFPIPVVGITGSVGKTSTKEMTAAALRVRYNTLASEKNYNTEIGVPLTLFRLDSTHEVAVIEMGMRGLGQIDRLAEIAEPTIGVITNIGFSHIELLGSQQNIAQAKSELLARLPARGVAILPIQPGSQIGCRTAPEGQPYSLTREFDLPQDQLFAFLRGRVPKRVRVITYGRFISAPADISMWSFEDLPDGGTAGLAVVRNKEFLFSLQVPGEHNVVNAQAAVAVAVALRVPVSKALGALADWQGAEGRLVIKTGKPTPGDESQQEPGPIHSHHRSTPELRRLNHSETGSVPTTKQGFKVIDDCYNASPESMEAALQILAQLAGQQKIAILGDMKELGEMALEAHRIVGRRVAEIGLRTLITVGPLAKEIRDEVRRRRGNVSYPECYHYADADEAASRVHLFVNENSAVLVKGSRAMHMEKIVAALTGEAKADAHD